MEVILTILGAVVLFMFGRLEHSLGKMRDAIDRHTASTDGLIALLNRINGKLS